MAVGNEETSRALCKAGWNSQYPPKCLTGTDREQGGALRPSETLLKLQRKDQINGVHLSSRNESPKGHEVGPPKIHTLLVLRTGDGPPTKRREKQWA